MFRITFYAFCLLTLFYCCSNGLGKEDKARKNNKDEPTLFPSPTPEYRRDSLYIAHTVREFMDKAVDIFDYYKQYNIPLDKVIISVDSILYSPDGLKLFSFVIIKNPNIENNKPDDYFYSGSDFVGYRENKKTPWSIWYFGQYRPTGFRSYDKVKELFRTYYLRRGRFKDDYDSYWDGVRNDTLSMARSFTFPKENNRIDIKFGYNLDNPRFWDSSIVWKKGTRIPDYYAFQTIGNVAPGYGDSLVKVIPPLSYPDSLLRLYK